MIDDAILRDAEALLNQCRAAGLRIATAESCTGGLIAATLTAIAGSSDVVDRGFVTYSNRSKTDLVGVPPETIETHGAVSQQVAKQMAEGALKASQADIAISVTGVAGPGGGTPTKPVGLVWFGCARHNHPTKTHQETFPGTRTQIRAATVTTALTLVRATVD